MFKILPAVLETSESQSSLNSSRRELTEASLIRKFSGQSTSNNSMFNIIQSKKDFDGNLSSMKSKLKQLELKNIRNINNSENIKKKQGNLELARRELETYKTEVQELKKEEEHNFERKEILLTQKKRSFQEKLCKAKENIQYKNSENKPKIIKDHKENEEFIGKREYYYMRKAKEKSNNPSFEVKSNAHIRARSAFSNFEKPAIHYQEDLLAEIIRQRSLLERLETLAKKKKIIRISQQRKTHSAHYPATKFSLK